MLHNDIIASSRTNRSVMLYHPSRLVTCTHTHTHTIRWESLGLGGSNTYLCRWCAALVNLYYWLCMMCWNRCLTVKSLRKKVLHLSKMLPLIQLASATGPKQGMRCTLCCTSVSSMMLHILVPLLSLSEVILNILWFRSCLSRGEYHLTYARWFGTSIPGLKRWAWKHFGILKMTLMCTTP